MFKVIKKVILSSLSILGISLLFWVIFLLNPSLSYANKTPFDYVTVYHNQDLDEHAKDIVNGAINIIKDSELFDNNVSLQLCLNDDLIYPNLHQLVGDPLAYAIFNKTIVKNCTLKFEENVAEAKWAVNNYELRNFNLTWLLAHEFTHNLQYHANPSYVIRTTLGNINWKLEGHAEYISRQFKNDGRLKEKIAILLEEQKKEFVGLPVFDLEDGTKQMLSYYKYGIVVQYLMEEKGMNFTQICELEKTLNVLYSEMLAWNEKQD